MNRRDLTRKVAETLRINNVRKSVSTPKQVFHISDDEGNQKDFTIRKTDKKVLYTIDDVDAIIDATLTVIEDSLKRGEAVNIHGFGSLGLHYRKARATKRIDTGEWVDVEARYVPKFNFGNNLRMAAKIYELSLQDTAPDDSICDEVGG